MVSHWPIPNVRPPSHSQSQWQCGRVEEHKMVCSDWLVCQTISACNNPITVLPLISIEIDAYYMYGSNSGSCILCIRMLRCNSDGHIELGDGPLNSVDGPQVVFACPLNPQFCAFSNTLCGMSQGDQHTILVPVP